MSKTDKNYPSQLLDLLEQPSDKAKHEEYYYSPATQSFRQLMLKLIDKKVKLSVGKSDDPKRFELPAWSEYQASESGYRRALKEIYDLLDR